MSTLEQDLLKARETVAEWEAKAQAARDEADRIDRESGEQILNDPSAAERIELKVQAQRRTARAMAGAADAARARIDDVYRKHLEVERKQLVKDAASRRKAADDHTRKVGKLLDQLRDLDGVDYEPVLGHAGRMEGSTYVAPVDGARQTTADRLSDEAGGLEAQAALVAFYIEHGRRPTRDDLPGTFGPVDPMHSIDAPPVLAGVIAAKAG